MQSITLANNSTESSKSTSGSAPHDHTVINTDGGVEYMRENGQVVNDYRDYRG